MKHADNTDRNGVNKQNTHQTLSMKINDTSPFLKQTDLFYQPLHYYDKNLNPSFSKILETQPRILYKSTTIL